MNLNIKYRWQTPEPSNINSKSYVCGHCGNPLASQMGFSAKSNKPYGDTKGLMAHDKHLVAFIYICQMKKCKQLKSYDFFFCTLFFFE